MTVFRAATLRTFFFAFHARAKELNVIIAIFLAVTLWRVDGAAALKCNGYRLESSLAGHLDKRNAQWRKSLVCECTGKCITGRECTVWESIH